MHSKWVFKHFRSKLGSRLHTLAVLWLLSLMAGILLCCLGPYSTAGALVCATPVAPLGLFLVCILPVTATAIALTSSLFAFSYLTVFLCGLSNGFCGIMVFIELGNAAWLLRPLVLFSAGGTSVLVWWLILQNETARNRLHRNIRLAVVLSCLIFVLDLFVVSPIIDDLIKYF